MQLGDILLRIKGDIPRLREDRETDFILSIDALAALTSIPLDALLLAVSSGDVSLTAGTSFYHDYGHVRSRNGFADASIVHFQ